MRPLEAFGGFILIVALFIGLFFAGLAFNFYTAPFVGKTNEQVIIQSAQNRIGEQEKFAQQFNDIQKADTQLSATESILAGSLSDSDRSHYVSLELGQKNYCISLVTDYNALTEKVSAEDFRDQSFPSHIDVNQHCK